MTDDNNPDLAKSRAAYEAALREGRIEVEYPPILREPIYYDPDRMPLLPSDNVHDLVGKNESQRRKKYADKVQAESDARWHWLFATYGINDDPKKNPNCAVDLLVAMAKQHVPGLRTTSEPPAPPKARKRRGAAKKYDMYDDAYLVRIVGLVREEMVAERGGAKVTIADAVRRAFKTDYFGKLKIKPNGKKMTEKSMIVRYHEAETRWKNHFFNKKILEGKHHTPQTLAKDYLDTVKKAGEGRYE